MRYLHALVHQQAFMDLHDRSFLEGITAGQVPEVPLVRCPTCTTAYFADLPFSGDEPWEAESVGWLAWRRLFQECPDHGHAFVV